MKKRIQRKIEKQKREKILKLYDLALQINGLEARRWDETGDKPTVIMKMWGHVNETELSIYRDGWDYGTEEDIVISFSNNPSEQRFCKLQPYDDVLQILKEELRHVL